MKCKNGKKQFLTIFILSVLAFTFTVFALDLVGPPNNGFESGLSNWISQIGTVNTVKSPYAGSWACLIDGNAASLLNGGFENGLTGWINAVGDCKVSSGSYGGSYALGLGANGQAASINSSMINAMPGVSYYLSAYVKYTNGIGNYKITIAWLNSSNGVVRYDNDWKGRYKSPGYFFHGGIFTAPAGTAKVQILLGVQARTCCLFDNISFGISGYSSINSAFFAVQGATSYKLSAYVKQVVGVSNYKVTLLWFNSSNTLLRMDNDWKGKDHPASYSLETVCFMSPKDAAKAQIIIGVCGGNSVLFDAVSLYKAYEILDNGKIRIGINGTFGGAIDYLATSGAPSTNYVNVSDDPGGRLIQRSFWGTPYTYYWPSNGAGGVLDPTHAPWNPVQGGDWQKEKKLYTGCITFERVDQKTVYVMCQPITFDSISSTNLTPELTNTRLETWYILEPNSNAVKIKTKFTNYDAGHDQWRDQEVLALYVNTVLRYHWTYEGNHPFTNSTLNDDDLIVREKTTNNDIEFISTYSANEYWSAWTNSKTRNDPNNFGVGIFAQDHVSHYGFFYLTQGNSDPMLGYNNESSITTRFSIPKNSIRYDETYVILDTLKNIRNFVYAQKTYPSGGTGPIMWHFDESNNRQGWSGEWVGNWISGYNTIDDTSGIANSVWTFNTVSGINPSIVSPNFEFAASLYSNLEICLSAPNASKIVVSWDRIYEDGEPLNPDQKPYDRLYSFPNVNEVPISSGGSLNVYQINMSGHPNWKGIIRQLKIRFVGATSPVKIDYISIK